MKTSNIIILSLLVFILAISTIMIFQFKLNFKEIKSNDKKVIIHINSFSKIDIENGVYVYFKLQDTLGVYRVKIESDSMSLDAISIRVENEKLKISFKRPLFRKKVKITVYGNKLDEVNLAAGASLNLLDTLKYQENLLFNAHAGSEAWMKGNFGKIKASCSSGSHIRMFGKSRRLDVNCSAGAMFKSKELLTDSVIIVGDAGSMLEVLSYKFLDVKASSGCIIEYRGNPIIKSQLSMGALLEKKD